MQYVDVLVNKSKIYTYLVPKELSVEVGNKVIVSLRGKDKEGFVISFCEEPEFKVVAIKSKVSDLTYFSEELVELAKYISDYYKCFYTTALKAILP